jgi:hypothetical protein
MTKGNSEPSFIHLNVDGRSQGTNLTVATRNALAVGSSFEFSSSTGALVVMTSRTTHWSTEILSGRESDMTRETCTFMHMSRGDDERKGMRTQRNCAAKPSFMLPNAGRAARTIPRPVLCGALPDAGTWRGRVPLHEDDEEHISSTCSQRQRI